MVASMAVSQGSSWQDTHLRLGQLKLEYRGNLSDLGHLPKKKKKKRTGSLVCLLFSFLNFSFGIKTIWLRTTID